MEGKCLSYSRGVAFHPIIDVLKSTFDIMEGDEDVEIRNKVTRGLKALKVEEATKCPYVLELLSVKESGIEKSSMSPEARKERIMEAVRRITIQGSEIRPLVLAIEDLHWMDKSSEDYLKTLLESISGVRVLLILTYRPEYVTTWGAKSFHNNVTLNRLSNRESLSMLAYLLGTNRIEQNLEELVLEKAEGIPFFIEEFTKSFRDLDMIVERDGLYCFSKGIQKVKIPSTIQDVIMARVDILPEGSRDVLQTGSVIEREFNYELINEVTGVLEQDLISHLSILKDAELLYERGIFPQSTYIFKHALTQEVVYGSILEKKRKKLHKEIANSIERLYANNLDEYYGILAQHYITGENHEKGAIYSELAGKKAEKDAAFTDAIAYGEKRVFCLEKLPLDVDVQKKIIDARTTLGLYLSQMGDFASAKETIDPITNVVLRSGDKRRISQIHMLIGIYYTWIETDIPKAIEQQRKALEIAEEINDNVSLLFSNYWLGIPLYIDCEFEKARYHIKQALNINVAANNPWGIVVGKSTLSGAVYIHQGKVDLAFQTSLDAMQIAEETDDIYSKTWSYTYHGWSCYFKGFLDEAIDCLLNGAKFSNKIRTFRQYFDSERCLSFCYLDIGDYEKSIEDSNNTTSIAEHARYCLDEKNLNEIALATARVMNDERDIHINSLFGYVAANKIKVYEGWMRRYIGEILLNIDDQHISEASHWIGEAIEADERNGIPWLLGRDYALYAELFKRKGDLLKARENFGKAIDIFGECGSNGWVEKYEKELADLR